MSELVALSPREALGRALVDAGEADRDVVVVTADVGDATRARYFGERFPDRYFNVGISEQNMVGVATGLALAGYKPYAVAFSMFLMRAWEQIRNSPCRLGIPVRLVGTHSGFSDAYDGASHQSLEDLALMRVLPGMVVIAPSDSCETYEAVLQTVDSRAPVYIRVGRELHLPTSCTLGMKFEVGRGYVVRDGSDVAIISTGIMLHFALEAGRILEERGIDALVAHFPTVQPLDTVLVERIARRTGAIVTVEEHSVRGGLGSAIAETLTQAYPVPMAIMGTKTLGRSAKSPMELLEYYGLTAENIAHRAEELVKTARS